ncbi:MAG TPA: signal peptidase I [Methanobacterium sp.]|nr:signal peptidase I [Methanobacterium sp.]
MQRKAKLLISIVCIIAVISIVSLIGVIELTSASSNINSSESTEYVVVVSNSMEPSIYRGDIVKVENNPSNIDVGDIIIYKATWIPEEVLHRVTEVRKAENGTTYFIAKGDNNPVQDPEPVYQNQIVSKVVTSDGQPVVIPKIGYISLWIRGL